MSLFQIENLKNNRLLIEPSINTENNGHGGNFNCESLIGHHSEQQDDTQGNQEQIQNLKQKIEQSTIHSHISKNVDRQCALWLSSKINNFIWPINETFCSPSLCSASRLLKVICAPLNKGLLNSGLKCMQWYSEIHLLFMYTIVQQSPKHFYHGSGNRNYKNVWSLPS